MSTVTIPTEIDRDDFLAAIKPLLDLCGVDAFGVYPTILITEERIEFTMIAQLPDGAEMPDLKHPQGDEVGLYAEWTLPIQIALV